jgi:hypothetical protein
VTKYIQGKNGKMAGSIGDGKTKIPTAAPTLPNLPTLPATASDTQTGFTSPATANPIWNTPHGTVLLGGIVGSTAYGLARPDSDKDRIGIYAAPTHTLVGLDPTPESHVTHEPSDITLHEARKYVTLALQANPTITELLWLDTLTDTTTHQPLHETIHPLGTDLISIRTKLLSADRVRDAYLGYATAQFKRLEGRYDHMTVDGERRIRKHALHMARLVNQGHTLYTTGHLETRVTDPDWYRTFAQADLDTWTTWFAQARDRFAAAETVLPATADRTAASTWLAQVRDTFWTPGR